MRDLTSSYSLKKTVNELSYKVIEREVLPWSRKCPLARRRAEREWSLQWCSWLSIGLGKSRIPSSQASFLSIDCQSRLAPCQGHIERAWRMWVPNFPLCRCSHTKLRCRILWWRVFVEGFHSQSLLGRPRWSSLWRRGARLFGRRSWSMGQHCKRWSLCHRHLDFPLLG